VKNLRREKRERDSDLPRPYVHIHTHARTHVHVRIRTLIYSEYGGAVSHVAQLPLPAVNSQNSQAVSLQPEISPRQKLRFVFSLASIPRSSLLAPPTHLYPGILYLGTPSPRNAPISMTVFAFMIIFACSPFLPLSLLLRHNYLLKPTYEFPPVESTSRINTLLFHCVIITVDGNLVRERKK
jgi:hypothetical protein